MAQDQDSRTEKPTAKRLEEAGSKGQFARSTEINTIFSLLAALVAIKWTGEDLWRALVLAFQESLTRVTPDRVTPQGILSGMVPTLLLMVRIVAGPVLLSMAAAVIAGGIQSRFAIATGALELRWNRLNPIEGFQGLFQTSIWARTAVKLLNLGVILAVGWSLVWELVNHPVFLAGSDLQELLRFMSNAVDSLLGRLLLALVLIAALDYGYQLWKTSRDLMMTKQEVKEETRSAEGDPETRSRLKGMRKKMRLSWRVTVPTADVVVTNPTHLAVALKFDATVDRAPRVVAKGKGYNALRIREIAKEFQVPIVENKPVARLLFQWCEEGQAIDARLYQAVAEILAFLYRTNSYRYYRGLRGRVDGS
ncbi:MAG: flagellar biosynthesis protein FlhB [Verrucomicrobiota bacterium]